MRPSLARLVGGGLIGLLIVAMVGPVGGALGYIGENPYIVKLSAPRQVNCSGPVTIQAKIRSSDTGDPGIGQAVDWDVKVALSPQDKISPVHTVTNNEGKTSATLTFGQVDGQRTVRVMIASWPTTIRVSCVGAVASATASPSPAITAPPTTAPAASAGATAQPTATHAAQSPSAAPTAPATPTITPMPAITPAATPDIGQADAGSSLTGALLPLGVIVVVLLGLGGLVLFARRR